jgi:AcrR family transcriptional regulator
VSLAPYVVTVNIRLALYVDSVNTSRYDELVTLRQPVRRPASPRARYHHGDLPRALLAEAVRTIQKSGVDSLTLRAVGQRLGVSRSALYRHFASKDDLLAAVADEGFRMLRTALRDAWAQGGRNPAGLDAMGWAYVRFAIAHPSHYRVMFGAVLRRDRSEPEPGAHTDAFGVLADAIVELQRSGVLRPDDPRLLASYIWAVVHGVAMLALDGALSGAAAIEQVTRFAIERLHTGIDADAPRE